MAIEGSITLNELSIAEVDSDPSVSGADLPIGSIATIGDGVNFGLYLKTGPLSTNWTQLSLSTGSFTQGSIPFGSSNGDLIQDNTNLFFDDANNRLGLGLTTPRSRIHIDAGTGTASNIKFTAGTTTGQTATDGFDLGISATGAAEIRQRENLGLSLFTNNSERFSIQGNGNVRSFGNFRYASLTEDFTNYTTFNGITSLTSAASASHIFTGTATGQIVRLPNATTLINGRKIDILNLSTQKIDVQDFAGNLITKVKPNARGQFKLLNNTTTAGVWTALNSASFEEFRFQYSQFQFIGQMNFDQYLYSYVQSGGETRRSGDPSNGYRFGNSAPLTVAFNGKVTSATASITGIAQSEGSPAANLELKFELWKVGFNSEGTKLGDIIFNIVSANYTIGNFWDSSILTGFGEEQPQNINVSAGDLLGLKFIRQTGNNKVVAVTNATVVLQIVGETT
jgi:hypothetical protein